MTIQSLESEISKILVVMATDCENVHQARAKGHSVVTTPTSDHEAALLKTVDRYVEERELELDALYTETEKNYPPNTFNFAEQQWNDGFYRGQLKALELVAVRVFGKHGDELAAASPSKKALRQQVKGGE